MSWRVPISIVAGIVSAFSALWITAFLVNRPLSILWPPEGSNVTFLRPDCAALEKRSDELLALARKCEHDDQCFHYPCSCSALARGPHGQEYILLQKDRQDFCAEPLIFAYCGRTTPVCREGQCTVKPLARRGELPIPSGRDSP